MREKWLTDMQSTKLKTVFFGNNPELLLTLIKESSVCSIFCRSNEDENILKIKDIAHSNNIPVLTPSKKELYSYVSYLQDLNADLFMVCGYKYIIPKDVFEIPPVGTINIHPSLLPLYRGQHVINWAIINGENKTGITFHFINEGIDTGDILLQREISISTQDTAYSLHQKLYTEASSMLCLLLDKISLGHDLKPLKQKDENATYFGPRKPEDGRIDWSKSGRDVCNLIRGLVKPWPGAYTLLEGTKVVLWKAHFQKYELDGLNGQIIDIVGHNLYIKVKDGLVICDEYSFWSEERENFHFSIQVGKSFE